MKRSESKYFNTAVRMDEAFLELLDVKDFEYITVKEICERAGVNRSTFYLHYETVADLLDESVEYMNRRFSSYFTGKSQFDVGEIATADIGELYLITPQYLIPYLQYIKDHQRLFRTVLKKSDVLGSNQKMQRLFQYVCSPIMDRYHIAADKQPFMLSFYIEGIIGIIKTWIKDGCQETVEFIAQIITECVRKPQ